MAPSATETANKVTINDAGPCRKTIAIEIPADAVDAKLADSLEVVMLEAQLPGFRKGFAPRKLIEKRFGPTIRGTARTELIQSAVQNAIETSNLRLVGEPFADGLDKIELFDGKPFAFQVSVEVLPEFEMPKLDGIQVRKPIVSVPDDIVDREVERICVNEGSLEERQNAEPGDYLTGHAVMTGPDKQEFYNLKGAVVQIPTADKDGKGMILGVMVDDFAKQFGKPKPGETVTVKVEGPAHHEIEELRGKPLSVAFTVDRIDRIIAAKAEDIATRAGFPSVDALKSAVKARIEQRAFIQQQTVMRQQVSKFLVDHTKFDLPERLSAQQSARSLERKRTELMYRGFEPHQIEEHLARVRNQSASAAQRDLKLFFILNKAAEDLDVKVTEGEINARIAQMAASRGVRPDKLRADIIRQNAVPSIYQQIREHKAMDSILAKAEITEMPADEFNKIMEQEQAGAVAE
ncbi:MAG: trigger factor [Phycisphaerales bacterium]|jgi:trigger factor|nr:trigger factor [Phycisphaerales bacterium]